jgi:hypothetical protein
MDWTTVYLFLSTHSVPIWNAVAAEAAQPRGAPFDVFPLPAVTRHNWNLLVLIRFLLRLMTSQTSGAGQEAPGLGGWPRNNKV